MFGMSANTSPSRLVIATSASGTVSESSRVLLKSVSIKPSSSASPALSQPSGRLSSTVVAISSAKPSPPICQSFLRSSEISALRSELPPSSGMSRSPCTPAVSLPFSNEMSIFASPCRNWLASKSMLRPSISSILSTAVKVAVTCKRSLCAVIFIRSLLAARAEERTTVPLPPLRAFTEAASEACSAAAPSRLSMTPLRSIARSISGILASSVAMSSAALRSSLEILYTGSPMPKIFKPETSMIISLL